MKKILKIFIICFIFNILNISISADNLKIHYKRYEKDYDKWNLWIWEEGKQGKTVDFTQKDDFGIMAEIEAEGKIGFLLKKGEWNQRDVLKDRYIKPDKNIKEIYLVEGNENIFYNESEADVNPKVKYADLSDENIVEFELRMLPKGQGSNRGELMKKDFVVKDQFSKKYEINKIEFDFENNKKGKIYLKENLPLDKKYSITVTGHEETDIALNKIFSTKKFEEEYGYIKNDLGALYEKESTKFRVWAPTAEKVVLNLYKEGSGDNLIKTVPLKRAEKGTWYAEEKGDLNGIYYTYSITAEGMEAEAVDLYAKAVGINGKRGMIIDLSGTNPKGWEAVERPKFENQSDAIVYEIHVRDFSIDESSGLKNKGKYLGMVEENGKNIYKESTGIDYLKKLGITHVQILPCADYASINEEELDKPQFNWGYDPENYQVPEGSYSANPYNAETRIKEFKEMVMKFHENGIRVIMDVVFNHTAKTENSNFNKIVPNYYYRKNGENFANASACGNETASERVMMRKYIADTVAY